MTEQPNWDHMDGFATAHDRGPELTAAGLEQVCEDISDIHSWGVSNAQRGEGFAFFAWTRVLAHRIVQRVREHGSPLAPSLNELRAKWDVMQEQSLLPRMRTEVVPLFDGDTLIGQMTIERPFDARDNLPFVERIHPDDEKKARAEALAGLKLGEQSCGPDFELRVQRFNLENGRYRLEH